MTKSFLLAAIFFSNASFAEPIVHSTKSYYTVKSNSVQTMYSDFLSATPIFHDDKKFFGFTSAKISWDFTLLSSNNTCSIESVNSYVNIELNLPALTSSNYEVREIFNSWFPKLEGHENKHVQMAINAAHKIENRIHSLEPNVECGLIEKSANAAGEAEIVEFQVRNLEYDESTEHGLLEGTDLLDHINH